MTRASFAERCGVHDAARQAACEQVLEEMRERRLQRVRVAWCDTHGMLRGKTLMPDVIEEVLHDGVGMVGTLMLKDSSDRTVYPVFDAPHDTALPGFQGAGNLQLLPDPRSFRVLPWAEATGWMQGQPWFADGSAVALDTRRVLQHALERLASAGYGLRCGLEVEFHIYRIDDARLDPAQAAWPGEPPVVSMIHPGYNLLAEGWADMADDALLVVQRTAQGLGLPLRSIEIELGPSQVEAVFDVTEALVAADAMVIFRNGVKQALRRAGYHASFVCRPPFANVMSSGWHLHQSLVDLAGGANAFVREHPQGPPDGAAGVLSACGEHYLAGLLEHACASAVFCVPTLSGFERFRPRALAPVAALWGRDNRGAMLRVIGTAADPATRIENRIGEPAANPYLYMASQIHAGLDGIERGLSAPPATEAPYSGAGVALPGSMSEALDALMADTSFRTAMGEGLVDHVVRIKRNELARHDAAEDKALWQRREYFGRI